MKQCMRYCYENIELIIITTLLLSTFFLQKHLFLFLNLVSEILVIKIVVMGC